MDMAIIDCQGPCAIGLDQGWTLPEPRNDMVSLGNKKQPGGSQNQEHEQTKTRGQQTDPVELALGHVVAADEDDVLAAPLRGDGREVAAGE